MWDVLRRWELVMWRDCVLRRFISALKFDTIEKSLTYTHSMACSSCCVLRSVFSLDQYSCDTVIIKPKNSGWLVQSGLTNDVDCLVFNFLSTFVSFDAVRGNDSVFDNWISSSYPSRNTRTRSQIVSAFLSFSLTLYESNWTLKLKFLSQRQRVEICDFCKDHTLVGQFFRALRPVSIHSSATTLQLSQFIQLLFSKQVKSVSNPFQLLESHDSISTSFRHSDRLVHFNNKSSVSPKSGSKQTMM